MIEHAVSTPRVEKNWLCIAYAFPPINRSGTHRTLGFVRHLSELGWNATVLTVNPSGEPTDDALTTLVPGPVDVIRTEWHDLIANAKRFLNLSVEPVGCHASREARACVRDTHARNMVPLHGNHATHGNSKVGRASPDTCLPKHVLSGDARPTTLRGRPRVLKHAAQGRRFRDWISRLITIPDSRLGWYGPACRAGKSILRARRFDVIYSTSPYMTAHLIAQRLSRSFGIPWVADFRDPWRDNPFREIPYGNLDRWDAFLERCVLRRADHIVCNTPTMRARLCERLPFVAKKSTVIMNGFDHDRLSDIVPARLGAADEFVLTHAGQFYGRRSPLHLFRALRRAMDRQSTNGQRIRLVLIGPDHYDGVPLELLAREEGVAERVSVMGPKPHREALSILAGSDAVLLVGSSGAGSDLQVPNKLFEYLVLRRPILAAVAPTNPSVDVLKSARADAIVCAPEDINSLTDALLHLAVKGRALPNDTWDGVDQFDRSRRAAELVAVFASGIDSGLSNFAAPNSSKRDRSVQNVPSPA